ncbi:MAG: MotA/TolQ/ExbB proton channel family protein [Chlamydiae bacterium]|nr:MotA/TolQ/ExbB proton channel family protein [Chlamydiota bacterium]
MKRFIVCTVCLFSSQLSYGEDVSLVLEPAVEESLLSEESSSLEIEKELLSLEDELLHVEDNLEVAVPSSEESKAPEHILIPVTDPMTELQAEPLLLEEPFLAEETLQEQTVSTQESPQVEDPFTLQTQEAKVHFSQVFAGSPWIYLLLFGLSSAAVSICLYSIVSLRRQRQDAFSSAQKLKEKLLSNNFASASEFCQNTGNLLSQMIAGALACRKHGLQAMMEGMRAEGKRASLSSWQQLSLLHDIAIIAPMLGLLGTVVGLFYAFYDINRSVDSINNLLDGLGISVGTTVAGIVVAILAMILHSLVKFRLMRTLARVEAEAASLTHLMQEKQ